MAGITDLPFRVLCREQGCDMVCTEMVSAKGMLYNMDRSEPLLVTRKEEQPVGVQIFGSEPDIMAKEAAVLAEREFAYIDINMGCPVPKIVNNGEGSSLLKNPELVGRIVKAVSSAVDKPVTVKIRAGFDKDSINAPLIARVAEENGAAAVAVHARTREQFYQGVADWSVIKAVKDAEGRFHPQYDENEETGCDSVMVGRAAKGNPWVFAELKDPENFTPPTVLEIKKTMIRQADMMREQKGEYTAIHEMRKHVAWYMAGVRNSSRIRREINTVGSYEELVELVMSLDE